VAKLGSLLAAGGCGSDFFVFVFVFVFLFLRNVCLAIDSAIDKKDLGRSASPTPSLPTDPQAIRWSFRADIVGHLTRPLRLWNFAPSKLLQCSRHLTAIQWSSPTALLQLLASSLMVDILSTIGSIIQLVDTALKAREDLKDFRNAPGEQLKLFAEMDDLKLLLAELQKRVSASPSTSTLQQIAGPLSRFNTMIERFATKWPAEDRERSKFTKQLTWTLWNKKESKECLDEVESIKSLINVWLTMDIGCVSISVTVNRAHLLALEMQVINRVVSITIG
jgi:hypothetical protein